MWQKPTFYFFHRIVRWLPSTTANNPENAETEGASVAGVKGGQGFISAIGLEETTEGCL
jgi:hypothetical protein